MLVYTCILKAANRLITIDYLYFDRTYVARYYEDTYSIRTVDLNYCAIKVYMSNSLENNGMSQNVAGHNGFIFSYSRY